MSNEDSPLTFATTDELIDELNRRYEVVVFAATRIRGPRDFDRLRRWQGHPDMVAGLAMAVAKLALEAIEKLERDSNEDVRLEEDDEDNR